MIPLLTNCPNCGAPLNPDGYCEYCGTKIRYANELELQNLDDIFGPNEMEILLKIVKKDAVVLVPIRGRISSIKQECDYETFYADGTPYISARSPNIEYEIVFNGYLDRESK